MTEITYTQRLRDALLDLELHGNRLERALGRGGAPFNLDQAREAVPEVERAVQQIAKLLALDGAT